MKRPNFKTADQIISSKDIDLINGKLLFQHINQWDGILDDQLRQLVTKESLLQMILLAFEHQTSIKGKFYSSKSKIEATKKKEQQQDLLFDWLDKNIQKYEGALDKCAIDARDKVPGLGRSLSWIRKKITFYKQIHSPTPS
jgi:hypothetical protein